MQKMLTKYLCAVMLAATLFLIAANYCLISGELENKMLVSSQSKMDQLAQMLEKNEKELAILEESLAEGYLTKCQSFAYIINQTPEVLEDPEELERIRMLLNVDELHVTDENGVLRWGTVEKYFGSDFHNNEHTAEFLQILENPEFTLVQDMRPNGVERKAFQYVGVARRDKKGIVVVGLNPSRYVEAKQRNELPYVFSKVTTADHEFIYAIDAATNVILAHTYEEYIGQNVITCGFPENYIEFYKNGAFFEYDGTRVLYVLKQYGNTIIGVGKVEEQLYEERMERMLLVVLYLGAVCIVIIVAINELLRRKIISGVYRIMEGMSQIGEGNLDTAVRVDSTPEFTKLSDGINDMVKSIVNSTVRISQIIEAVDVPMGAYEYNDKMKRVITTDRLCQILLMTEEEADILRKDKEAFVKYMELLRKYPEENEENVYKISEKPEQWIEIHTHNENGSVFGIIIDVTEEILQKRNIIKERDYDALTTLRNRRSFEKQVRRKMEQQENAGNAAMIMMDLDNFKQINDEFGHDYGDEYLQCAAKIMQDTIDEHCILGRRSGDEFYIYVDKCADRGRIQELIERLYKKLRENPVLLPDGNKKIIGISGGIAYAAQKETDYEMLLAEADAALYRAKKEKKGGFWWHR